MKEIQGKSIWVRVGARVRIIGTKRTNWNYADDIGNNGNIKNYVTLKQSF